MGADPAAMGVAERQIEIVGADMAVPEVALDQIAAGAPRRLTGRSAGVNPPPARTLK